jgi:regulator of RNase E activity RraA
VQTTKANISKSHINNSHINKSHPKRGRKMAEISKQVLEGLKALDTPTVCNALENVDRDRRARGFNVRPFVCAHPQLPSVVGYVRTARIRATHKPTTPADSDGYYTYIAEGGPVPSVVVIQDLDEVPGYGAQWGEVNTNVHFGLGCLGVVTNGSVRDIPDSQPGFQMLAGMVNPSHAWVHVVDWGSPVTIHGMDAEDGDLIHCDMHGAVIVPTEAAEGVIEEAKKIAAREGVLIKASQQPGFNMEKMREAWKGMAEIH